MYRNWNKQATRLKSRPLLRVIFSTFWKDYAILSGFCFINDILLRLGQPFILGYLLRYFRNDTDITYDQAILYAIGMVAFSLLTALFSNHILFISNHNGMKVRVAVCSLIYRKVINPVHVVKRTKSKSLLKY